MKALQDEEVVMNLKLLKRARFFHVFDPDSRKIYNWNVFLIPIITTNVVSQCVPFLVLMGFFVHGLSSLSNIDFFLVLFIILYNYITLFMLIRILNKSTLIWTLFPVTKFDFLTGATCARNTEILNEYRTKATRVTNFFLGLIVVVLIQWAFIPLALNLFTRNENGNRQMQNVFNYHYPVNTRAYNQYYLVFYLLEIMQLYSIGYIVLILDIILITFYYPLIGQYKVICRSFESIGFQDKTQKEHRSDFKSILRDQQQLNLKLRSFYSVVRPIILVYVAVNVVLIIVVMCLLISVYLSTISVSILLVKLISTVVAQYAHCFLYCVMFEHISNEVDSVNFAMYSCNWTAMDQKFKQLLLLAMRINNANKCAIKFSPKKFVNLQLFASVVTTSFNIISVLINTMN